MASMTLERLHELFDIHDDKAALEWSGNCHDCQTAVNVTATPSKEGIRIQGGCVYEPQPDAFFLKCNRCFQRDPLLSNYQHCEVYSRVVGYLRPTTQWNDAKQCEFKDRRVFDKSIRGTAY